jgi:hypothetical protein
MTRPRVVHLLSDGEIRNGVTIDNGIPIPAPELKKNGIDERWPMSQLQPGQSFFARGILNPGSFYTRAKKLGIKITVRKIGNVGVRVWRLKDGEEGAKR